MGSDGALDLAGLQAARADVEPLRGTIHESADALHVRVPPPRGPAVRVGDLLAEERLLPADVADGCHGPGRVPNAWSRPVYAARMRWSRSTRSASPIGPTHVSTSSPPAS